jgi:hypothetical protein
MGKLKPIGSEKLQGMEKIQRILEIAKYKESPSSNVNENTSDNYNIVLSDGNTYHINKEKNGYVITRTLSEGTTDYIEPMKNRRYYSSYSQAFKRLNLIAKEINVMTGNEGGISLFSEQKKFVLKTPNTPEPAAEPVAPAPAPAPSPEPTGVEPSLDAPDMEEPSMDAPDMEEPNMDAPDMEEPSMDAPDMDSSDDEDMVSFKTIQKLTGKLGQKLRKLNQSEEPISADDTKYVINSILSALDLSVLSDEDMEEIIGRLEDSEFESDEEPEMEEPTDEMEPEMEEPTDEMEPEIPEGEMFESENEEQWEGTMAGEYDLGFSDKPKKSEPKEMNFNNYVKNRFSSAINDKMGEMTEDEKVGLDSILGSVFSESKVDDIIKSYFVETESEKKFISEQKQKRFLNEKVKKMKIMKEVKNLSESFVQESTSSKFLDRFKRAKFIGKTNKHNLVFEVDGKQYKITPHGAIL